MEEDGEESTCLICVQRIATFALGVCNHRAVCGPCALRLRCLYKDPKCCVCKVHLPHVIFTRNRSHPFESFVLSQLPFESRWNAYFDDTHFLLETKKYWEVRCTVCQECSPKFKTMRKLREHLTGDHRRFLCDLCLEGRRVFPFEQISYSKEELALHQSTGCALDNVPLGVRGGHPLCFFCQVRLFGQDELYEHMVMVHIACSICQNQGERHIFYADYANLEKHFRTSHHPCLEPECLDMKYVVFSTKEELSRHQEQVHPHFSDSFPPLSSSSPSSSPPPPPPCTLFLIPRSPEESHRRNKALRTNLSEFGGEEKLIQFKRISGDYVKGLCTATQYYALFFDIYGTDAAAFDLFREIVSLLPDPLKREALIHVYKANETNETNETRGSGDELFDVKQLAAALKDVRDEENMPLLRILRDFHFLCLVIEFLEKEHTKRTEDAVDDYFRDRFGDALATPEVLLPPGHRVMVQETISVLKLDQLVNFSKWLEVLGATCQASITLDEVLDRFDSGESDARLCLALKTLTPLDRLIVIHYCEAARNRLGKHISETPSLREYYKATLQRTRDGPTFRASDFPTLALTGWL